MINTLNPEEYDDRTECERCGAQGLEPHEPCDCFEDDDVVVGDVPIGEVPPMSRDEFYAMLAEDPAYSGLVDAEDFENILIATVLAIDRRLQEYIKQVNGKAA